MSIVTPGIDASAARTRVIARSAGKVRDSDAKAQRWLPAGQGLNVPSTVPRVDGVVDRLGTTTHLSTTASATRVNMNQNSFMQVNLLACFVAAVQTADARAISPILIVLMPDLE